MKAIKIFSIALLSLLTFSSCSEDESYDGKLYAEDLRITADMWKLVGRPDAIGSYYECLLDGFPLRDAYSNGIITAYIYLIVDGVEVQTPLPYTEYHIGYNKSGEEVQYSIQFSYDAASDGSIAFKAYVSDYWTDDFRPGTNDFKVAILQR